MSSVRGKRRLQIDKLYEAAALAEESLPLLVQKMTSDLLDDTKEYAMKDRIAGLRALRDITHFAPRVDDDLGLTRKEAKTDSPVMLLLGDKGLSLVEFRSMDTEKRQLLVLEALSGNLPEPEVVEVEAEVANAE